MDQTQYYQMITDLEAVDEKLAAITGLETDAKWVYLIEACNYAAKISRDNFKSERNLFKTDNPSIKEIPPEIKEWDKRSDRLMKAAKNLMLPHALETGAQAYSSQDDEGKPVLLVVHPEAGMVALHQVNMENLDIQPAPDGVVFTGIRRQRLAGETADALLTNDESYLTSLKNASLSLEFANRVQDKMDETFGGSEAPSSSVRNLLRTIGKDGPN